MYQEDIPRKCLQGNDIEFDLWWKENGNKTDHSTITDMPCFKETKLGELCYDAGQILDEIKKLIDNDHNKIKT
jgi:hypothetical protein